MFNSTTKNRSFPSRTQPEKAVDWLSHPTQYSHVYERARSGDRHRSAMVPPSRTTRFSSVLLERCRRPIQLAISVAANTPTGMQARFQTTSCVIEGSPPPDTTPSIGPSHAIYVSPKIAKAIVQERTGRTEVRRQMVRPFANSVDKRNMNLVDFTLNGYYSPAPHLASMLSHSGFRLRTHAD